MKPVIDYLPEISQAVIERQVRRGKFIIADDEPEKVCTQCDESWPLTSEFWYGESSSQTKTHSWCKGCYLSTRYAKRRAKRGGNE
ncbi:conserved hypothetical protein [Vibrio coralliirubri]|uniref:hypothetical protein n=1 Tax=Vibrio coralliirubri TaxID=1516159 RepID=UPI00063611B0|nr:hypothetical protein [Vibrio coralliirubri]CDT53734.1 conserved hypothetical protein [Vibrio coralliirubri]